VLTYSQARQRHAMLRDAVRRLRGRCDDSERLAEAVWAGVVGRGTAGDLLSEAVSDTTPRSYGVLLATEDIPAAFATAAILAALVSHEELPTTPHAARQVAVEGWAEFEELADQAGHLQHGLGADHSAAWPILLAYHAPGVDTAQLTRIAQLAGRMLAVLSGVRARRVPHVPEEVCGVTVGADFAALLPLEYARLGHPATSTELMLRVSQRQAQQVERRGTDRQGKGPLVVAVDESGSMKPTDRIIWAKAALTALVMLAWRDKRQCVAVHFSEATRVTALPPGDWTALARAQSSFLDGGTDIATALDVAGLEVDALDKRGVKGADVVVISDGGDADNPLGAALGRLAKRQIRTWGVAIAEPWYGPLREGCAGYHFLAEGREGDAAAIGALAGVVAP